MGWDNGRYQDPAEAKSAAEAAEAMERRAAEADARTEAMATAIVEGFGLVAQAILAAAGVSGLRAPEDTDPRLVGYDHAAMRVAAGLDHPAEDEREDLAALLDGGDDTPK